MQCCDDTQSNATQLSTSFMNTWDCSHSFYSNIYTDNGAETTLMVRVKLLS